MDRQRWLFNATVALQIVNRLMQSVGANDPARYLVDVDDGSLRIVDQYSRRVEGAHTYEAVVLVPEEGRLEFQERARSGRILRSTLAGDVAQWRCQLQLDRRCGHFELVSAAGDRLARHIEW